MTLPAPSLLKTCILATLACLCAGSAHAVVGGEPDGGTLAGSTVMVLTSNGGVCSAVVVGEDTVLTAAHCAVGADQYRIHYRGDNGEAAMIEPAAKAVHPEYVAKAVAARKRSVDLALFKLGGPLPRRFSPARLSTRQPRTGTPILVGGYGISSIGDARSSGTFRTARLDVVEPYGPGRILVWAKSRASAGACNGDSGGPLVVNDAVVAVTAWATGTRTSRCGEITQGILLGPQRTWIDGVLSGWGRSAHWLD